MSTAKLSKHYKNIVPMKTAYYNNLKAVLTIPPEKMSKTKNFD